MAATKINLNQLDNASANSKLLGAGASGSGAAYVEITLGSNLSMSGTTLNASGGGSSAFTDITSGTNTTAAMVVGTGASLTPTGTGTIAATSLDGTISSASTATTQSQADNSTKVATTAYVDTGLGTKQATLVSGTNIKTINGSSVLGSGDLTVSAAAGGSDTQVQFNDGGALNGDADFTYDKTTNNLIVNGKIDSQSLQINGTSGSGHLDLKHQSADAIPPTAFTALFADSNGNIKYKNDGGYYTTLNTNANTANRVYTFQDKSYTVADNADLAAKQDTLTATNFGAFSNGLTAKTTPVDADSINIVDSSASNVEKKVTWANIKATLKTYFDTLYQSTITFGTGVLTALGVNVGSAGSVVINGGALGTPSSGVATNLTGTASGLTAGTVTTNANLTGDVTSVGNASTIANNVVTNAKLAQVATQTFKGRTTASTGNVEDLTATQATAILNNFTGDSGSGGVKGLVPAPSAGDAAANKFLKADGTFAVTPGALIWSTVTGTTQAMSASNAYIANNASQVVFTLPSTAAVGDTFIVVGLGAGGWRISQNSGQTIRLLTNVTTSGTSGYITSNGQYDSVTIICTVANTNFRITDATSIGLNLN